MEKKKIAFVCQRYGLEVNGGAELYCREIAEKLTSIYDVTVYTTCAIDYITWADKYKPGKEELNGVHIKRYRIKKERNQNDFGRIHQIVITNSRHSDREEQEWIDKQGPFCPDLINAIKQEHNQYIAVLFMTYLYYTTVRGITLNFNNAILIPTVHDEPYVYFRIYDKVFSSAKGIAWNTPEERNFAYKRFPSIVNTPNVMTGIGVECPQGVLPDIPENLQNEQYIVYAGRIDESKGCKELFRFYQRYKKEYSNGIKLVLMGKPVMDIPEDSDIISLGFVSEEMKYSVMAHSVALVLFSRYESLSMVVLESMIMGRPVLVTGHCDVLKGHCIRSNAGLYFNNYREFAGTLNYLLNHSAEYGLMCENGKHYVKENYQWDVIVQEYRELIECVGKSNEQGV